MSIDRKTELAGIVSVNPDIMHGIPCFSGTRVPVQTLLDFLETGETIDSFLAVYPYIRREQVHAFLEISRDLAVEQL